MLRTAPPGSECMSSTAVIPSGRRWRSSACIVHDTAAHEAVGREPAVEVARAADRRFEGPPADRDAQLRDARRAQPLQALRRPRRAEQVGIEVRVPVRVHRGHRVDLSACHPRDVVELLVALDAARAEPQQRRVRPSPVLHDEPRRPNSRRWRNAQAHGGDGSRGARRRRRRSASERGAPQRSTCEADASQAAAEPEVEWSTANPERWSARHGMSTRKWLYDSGPGARPSAREGPLHTRCTNTTPQFERGARFSLRALRSLGR